MQATATLNLPRRRGTRPNTSTVPPHRLLDQWPPPELLDLLRERCLAFEDVKCRHSRLANSSTAALCLPDRLANGPGEAFLDAHEFCHLHGESDGSIHLTLPQELGEAAIALEWAEQHLLAGAGVLPRNVLLVYPPRDVEELEVVLHLVKCSSEFARGSER